jgi:hypothetical protein
MELSKARTFFRWGSKFMRIPRLLVLVPAFSVALLGAASLLRPDTTSIRKSTPTNSAAAVDLCLASQDNPMGQGCCSWHGGECGFQNGRDVCCDGTLSPSCSCHK